MKKSCKNSKNHPCDVSVPFPEVGCSSFKPRRFYAVYVHNIETGYLRISNIFDNETFADAEVKCLIEKFSRRGSFRHFEIYSKPVDGVRSTIFLADLTLLHGCEQVAECLYLADYSIKKHGINKRNAQRFKHWFSAAQKIAQKGADILDNLNEL